jgi:intracellular multiplication protein IcmC
MWPDIGTMLSSLMSNLTELRVFVAAFCYIAGYLFAFRAIYRLKEYGELRTMMSSQTSIFKPIVLFIISAGLIFFPSLQDMAIETFYADSALKELGYDGNYYTWRGFITVVMRIVQFIGLIAFVRGWIGLAQLGNQSAPPGSTGKSMAHIIGGILAINIGATVEVLKSTIGMRW